MSRPAVVAVTLVALALFVLLATQEWVVAVVEAAPGAPRSAVRVTADAAVPWGPAAGLLGLPAGLLASARGRAWARLVLLAASATALASAVWVLARPAAVVGAGDVVSVETTAWAWAGSSSAALATVAAATSLAARPPVRDPAARNVSATAAEQGRREAADQWRSLSEGQDPTSGGA